MSKSINPLDPLSLMKHEAKLKKAEEKQLTTQERIQAVLAGEKPTDVMSWEFYIWKTYNDPLRIK
jgi:hypothetical protein